jgi:ABC-2 type transport system ATP-binding protein
MNSIEVKNLSKEYDKVLAVNGISFDVGQGEIFGFLGPNGAGKSTTIRVLSTLTAPTGGQAIVNGFDVVSAKNDVRKSIGLVFQDPSLDDRLSAYENLRFHAELYGVNRSDFKKRIQEVMTLVELWDRRNDIVKNYSGGMKRRLEIARGLLHYPKVLFLDEPTIGLDPQTRSHIWTYLLKLQKNFGMTIFMTTHYMNEAEYCNRIAIIDDGSIVALDTPENLKSSFGGDVVTVKSQDIETLRKDISFFYPVSIEDVIGGLQVEVKDGETFLPKLFAKSKAKIDSVELREPTIDDVFLKVTGKQIREESASASDRMRQQVRMRRR